MTIVSPFRHTTAATLLRAWLPLVALCGITLFAIVIRHRYWVLTGGIEANYVTWAATNYYGGISTEYLDSAARVLAGTWKIVTTVYPPGYSAIIAAVQFFGASEPQTYRLVQLGVDATGCVLAYAIVRALGARIFSALLAALLYAMAPWWGWSATLIMAESLLPVLTLAALLILLVIAQRDHRGAWFLGGMALAVLPCIRAEMLLFFMPILLWGLLQSQWPWKRRIVLSAVALIGFAIPLLIVATRNQIAVGEFVVSRSLSGYALFSGLGQVENTFGYFANDPWADVFLQSIGLKYHSPESERYWKQVYWDAWLTHPDHVIATIRYRFERILFLPDIRYGYFSAMTSLVTYGPGFLLAATVVILVRRQYAAILLIAGPLGYALATNGIMYMEPRYVRYAHVTYLLAAAIAFDGVLSTFRAGMALMLPSRVASVATAAAVVAACIPIAAWSFDEAAKLDRAARNTQGDLILHTMSVATTTDVTGWAAGVPDASIVQRGGSVVVTTSPTLTGYQAMAKVPTAGASYLVANFDIATDSQHAYLGILKGDGSVFLRQERLTPHQRTVGTMTESVDDPYVFMVIQSTEKVRAEVVLNAMRYALVCDSTRYALSVQGLRKLLFPRVSDWSFRPCAP